MKPKIIIVGGGFGGLAAASALAGEDAEVVVIDKQNHHLFQPLLYQVATAGLSPADIAWPIRRILRRQKNARVVMATVTGIDTEKKRVLMGEEFEDYDYLLLATGASHAYFGHDDWAPYAPGLKSINDATDVRRRVLMAFERAEIETDRKVRERLLTFVVVGGGPTGVEMAGAISEVARKALSKDFRRIDPRTARVLLIEAGPRLLSSFTPAMSEYARNALEKLGVDIRLGDAVTQCSADGVQVKDGNIPATTIIWAAGVAASPAANWLQAHKDRNNRVIVDRKLQVEGLPQVFVVGDTATFIGADGNPLPGVATVAKQQGKFVGRVIAARLRGKPEPDEFRYRDVGQLATIGRRKAVVDLGRVRFKGWLAWWFWGIVHIYFLVNNRSRLTIAIQWLWSYLTFDRGARLIVSDE